jgi:acetyl-CoA acetyltransferase
MDYFEFHTVINIIEESRKCNLFNIVSPSGGSIILGNSKGLSGFRAIVSIANQLKRKQNERGLAIIVNEGNDTAYLVVLKQ